MLPGMAWQIRLQTSGRHTLAPSAAGAGDAIAWAPPNPSAATVAAPNTRFRIELIVRMVVLRSVVQKKQAHRPASVHRPLMPPCARQLRSQPVGLHARASLTELPGPGAATACVPPNPSAAATPAAYSHPRTARLVLRILTS
jgi:hypothetical protein